MGARRRARPRLEQRRPSLGQRAERHRRDELPPLDEEAAVALTAALLRPAEYPPLRALRQLVAHRAWQPAAPRDARARDPRARRDPRAPGRRALPRHHRARRASRRSRSGRGSPRASSPSLGVELVALARVCAVLGGEVERDELVAIVDAVESRGGATTTIDVDIGLRELRARRHPGATQRGCAFRAGAGRGGRLRDDERGRAARAAPGGARVLAWQAARRPGSGRARRASRRGGRRAPPAARGVRDARRRAPIASTARSMRIRRGQGALRQPRATRGRTRPRAARPRAGALPAAAACATRSSISTRRSRSPVEIGDRVSRSRHSLEQATALDWAEDFTRSKEAATLARDAPGRSRDQRARPVEVDLAEARSLFRAQRFAEAEPRLRDVMARRKRARRQTIAGMLLATMLVDLGRLRRGGACSTS